MNIQITGQTTVSLRKAGKSLVVDFDKMPANSLEHVVEYGIRQILNDAMAAAKTEAEGFALAQKRLDNIMSGTLRASGSREGDPVRKRAIELAEAKIAKVPKFIAWVEEVKKGEKDSLKVLSAKTAKLRELAKQAIAKEGNAYMVQAAKDVEAAKELEVDEDVLDL